MAGGKGKSQPEATTSETKTIKLPSGRTLMVTPAPWRKAEALNDAIMEELLDLERRPGTGLDIKDILTKVILKGFSSPRIKGCVWDCMEWALLDKVKITEDTFEKVALRADYYLVCFHVAEVNVSPFTASLVSQFAAIIGELEARLPKSSSETSAPPTN